MLALAEDFTDPTATRATRAVFDENADAVGPRLFDGAGEIERIDSLTSNRIGCSLRRWLEPSVGRVGVGDRPDRSVRW